MADVYVTPVTGIPVVGHAIALPAPLPPYIADVIKLAAGVSVYVTAFTGSPFYRGI